MRYRKWIAEITEDLTEKDRSFTLGACLAAMWVMCSFVWSMTTILEAEWSIVKVVLMVLLGFMHWWALYVLEVMLRDRGVYLRFHKKT